MARHLRLRRRCRGGVVVVVGKEEWRIGDRGRRFTPMEEVVTIAIWYGKRRATENREVVDVCWCGSSGNVRWRVNGSGKARKETRLYFMMRLALFHVVSTRSSIL